METESGEKQKYACKEHSCKTCGKSFPTITRLVNHERVHTGERPYKCDMCEKAFSETSSLVKHKRIHTGEKPYSCDICQKSYSQNSQLSKHKKSAAHINRMGQMNVAYSTNSCDVVDCSESIKVKDIKEEIKEEENVEDPISIHHELDRMRLFSCDICEEKFTERIVLIMHKDINHSQPILQSVEDPLPIDNYAGSCVKHEVKEEVKESNEGQGVEDSNLDTDHLVDCSQYLQVQINLTK